jgi:hypothetical protein
MSLGFRETIVIDNMPQDKNFYILSTPKGIEIIDTSSYQSGNQKMIFNERGKLLINHSEKWHKTKIIEFINNPFAPKGLYYEIKQVLKQYIEFQKETTYGLISAWVIATYFHRCFNAFPFLFIYGRKQSGKSRTLELIERLAFNAMKIKGVSIASMSDSVDGVRGTFLNDQAESLSEPKNLELLGILSDSYTIGGGKRRIVDISKRGRSLLEFETYSPKAFASVKELHPDLKDRCIQITMIRTVEDYPYPEAHLPMWHELRDKLYRLSLIKWHEIRNIYQIAGQGVTQRVRELWRPIESVLKLECIPEREVKEIENFFLESMSETQLELSERELKLFEILFELLEDKEEDVFTVDSITNFLISDPVFDDLSTKSLQTWIGRKIKEFSLYSHYAGRKNGKRAYVLSKAHIENVLERYNQAVNTTSKPPSQNEVVSSEALKNKAEDHLTTSTTCIEEPIEILEVLSTDEVNFDLERKVYSEILDCYLWIVTDNEHREALKASEGISEVIYTSHEVKELKKLSTEDLKTIHKVREIFPDSTIEEIKRGKIK